MVLKLCRRDAATTPADPNFSHKTQSVPRAEQPARLTLLNLTSETRWVEPLPHSGADSPQHPLTLEAAAQDSNIQPRRWQYARRIRRARYSRNFYKAGHFDPPPVPFRPGVAANRAHLWPFLPPASCAHAVPGCGSRPLASIPRYNRLALFRPPVPDGRYVTPAALPPMRRDAGPPYGAHSTVSSSAPRRVLAAMQPRSAITTSFASCSGGSQSALTRMRTAV